ncbi:glycosyltransferase family 2 protein [Candidatus Daviesbacteria bacterium]|nr:glycosyltransferase family 2 protein [Candidatus Daviesbacteria bacterium]
MKKTAIITLNYNGKDDTIEFLESLKLLKKNGTELRVIVVDNASGDGSVSAIKDKFPDVDILQTGANLGFSGGLNKGIEYAKIWGADYFLLINNDCLIKDENLITELVSALEKDPKIGLVSPKIYFAKGFEYKKDYKKEDLGKVIWYGGGKFDWGNIGNIHKGIDQVDEGQFDQEEESEIFSGACVLVKREVLEELSPSNGGVEGLDERYFLYFEDSDLAVRVKQAGFKIYYNGQVSLYHKVSRSTGIGSQVTDYYHTRNRLIFGMQYGKFRTKFALLREAVKLFIFGRPAQRRGILDFYLGIRGGVKLIHPPGGKLEYPLKLSIGIVNYNTADLTKKLLESIFREGSGFKQSEMEIIVLDNGQIDPSKERIKEYLPRVKYLENKENEGFSKGYNKTIKYSLGEYYLMLNSDIEVLPNVLSELIKVEDGLEGKGVLGGKLVFPDLSSQDSAFHLPTLKGAFDEYFLGKKGSYFMFEPSLHPRGAGLTTPYAHLGGVIRVEGLVMACFMIPKKVLNKVGLLDESKFIFFEDIEYCRRLKQYAVPVYFVPAAKFIHHHGASTKKIGVEKANTLLTESSKKYHGSIYYFFLTWVLRLGQKFGRVQTPKSRWQS